MRKLPQAQVKGTVCPFFLYCPVLSRESTDTGLQCDGVRPKCNTCQAKNLTCVYDVAEDGKTTTQLRAHVRRLAKELDDMKSVVSLLAMAPDRAAAANWASELQKNGFAHHSADEIKKSLGMVRSARSMVTSSFV